MATGRDDWSRSKVADDVGSISKGVHIIDMEDICILYSFLLSNVHFGWEEWFMLLYVGVASIDRYQ